MTKRILGLLWRISLVSHVPAPLDMTMCFADVLRDYALTNKSPDTRALALDIVSQLVQELNGGDKALPAMRVLHHLISNSGNHAVSQRICSLMQPRAHVTLFHLFGIVLQQLLLDFKHNCTYAWYSPRHSVNLFHNCP